MKRICKDYFLRAWLKLQLELEEEMLIIYDLIAAKLSKAHRTG